jgi:hypothetical protein
MLARPLQTVNVVNSAPVYQQSFLPVDVQRCTSTGTAAVVLQRQWICNVACELVAWESCMGRLHVHDLYALTVLHVKAYQYEVCNTRQSHDKPMSGRVGNAGQQ